MNIQRINAIFEKDLKDFMKNTMLVFMPALPIFLSIFYSRMGAGIDEEMPVFIIYLVIGVTYSSVTAGGMMMMMAEENEKKTLRGLMMSPASFIDIIVGKSLVTALLTFLSLTISLIILNIEPFLNIKAIIGLLLLFLFFLFLGITVGLFVKSVGTTTAYLMPIMFLFGFTPTIDFLGFSENSIAVKIASTFPIMQAIKIHEVHSWLPVAIMIIWVLGAIIMMYFLFKKTKQDD